MSIISRRDKFNSLLGQWADFYDEQTEKLVNQMRRDGYNNQQIGEILGISGQMVRVRFPKQEAK